MIKTCVIVTRHQLWMASGTGFVWSSGCRACPALGGCCPAAGAAGGLRPRLCVAREAEPRWHIGRFPGASRDRGPASVGSLCVDQTSSRLCQREPRESCRRQCVQEPPSENKRLVAVSIHIQNSIVFTLFHYD